MKASDGLHPFDSSKYNLRAKGQACGMSDFPNPIARYIALVEKANSCNRGTCPTDIFESQEIGFESAELNALVQEALKAIEATPDLSFSDVARIYGGPGLLANQERLQTVNVNKSPNRERRRTPGV